jgi:hypothetical protein
VTAQSSKLTKTEVTSIYNSGQFLAVSAEDTCPHEPVSFIHLLYILSLCATHRRSCQSVYIMRSAARTLVARTAAILKFTGGLQGKEIINVTHK